ncbi:hypothetical protein FJT64_016536 [Amphibalanus amphitrite]|uniref:Uncharacterized protein n=1 Tax=Amphibalanus amphitrite TaxID=1232801 RepID=A0A6A4X9A7_AMPAM|nr:hypothetical protein FJT64_016536 [Amphibalanus amphitrite]
MTSTRAPTPWSATEPDDDDDATDEGLDEDEQLERADSSGSSSPFESVAATTDSSYHTLPTASSSVERADQVGDQPAEEIVQPRPMAAAVADEKTAQGAEVNEMSDGGRETHTDTTDTTETEVTEEDNSTTPRNTATHPAAPTEPANRTQPSSGLAVEPPLISLPPEQAAHSTGAPAGRAVTGGATAAGDQPPTITISDDVSLRYFCGTFQPADHHMTRYAGLEGAAAAPEPRPVPSGRSDSAVTPPGEAAAGRGRSAASDSRLGVRSSSPKPLTGEDSGVQLEAKRSTTDLPPQ